MDEDKVPATSELPSSDAVSELMKQAQALEPQEPRQIPKPKPKLKSSKSSNPLTSSNLPSANTRKSFDIIRPPEIKQTKKLKISAVSLPMASLEEEAKKDEPERKSSSGKNKINPLVPETLSSEITGEAEDFSESLPGFIEDSESNPKAPYGPEGDGASSVAQDTKDSYSAQAYSTSTSFETQIQPAAKTEDGDYHNIFDTEEYHPPLLLPHAATKKPHPILWTLFILFVVTLLIGGFFLLRYLSII